jgi:hypothetical protein
MSKLSKHIDAHITGEKKLKPMRYVSVKMDSGEVHHQLGIRLGIKVGVIFQQMAYVDELEMAKVGTEDVLRSIKRAMIEEIFGEFRPLIIQMHAASYDEDTVRLRTLLAEMENLMFHDGI